MTTYTCKDCGAPVSVKDGQVIRPCGCSAPVIAHLTAVATGESLVANSK